MRKTSYLLALVGVVVIVTVFAVGGSSGQGSSCGLPHSCSLSPSTGTFQIGDMITFSTDCIQGIFNPEEECNFRSCCEDATVFPSPVYYTGTDPGGSPIGCIQGSNPLSYTFQPGDEGTYTRKACVFSNCTNCTNTATITVQ